MRAVFAEGIKRSKDCSLMCSCTQTVRQFERITYTCMLRYCVSRDGLWKRGERRSTFGLNGHSTEVELRAQGSRPRTQKISEAKDSLFEDRPFLGQEHRRKCSQKNINNVFKKFFSGVLKTTKSKNLQKKTSFSTKNDLQNFKDSKNTTVLEPRTGQFSRT